MLLHSFIHSFTSSFNKYLSSTYCGPGTVLDFRDRYIRGPNYNGVEILVRRDDYKQIKAIYWLVISDMRKISSCGQRESWLRGLLFAGVVSEACSGGVH